MINIYDVCIIIIHIDVIYEDMMSTVTYHIWILLFNGKHEYCVWNVGSEMWFFN